MLLKRLSVFFLLLYLLNPAFSQEAKVQQLIDAEEFGEALSICDSILGRSELEHRWYYYFSKKADILYYQGDIKGSTHFYRRALAQPEIYFSSAERTLLETYSYLGFCLRELGMDQSAQVYFEQALKKAIGMNDTVEVAIAYYNIGTVLMSQGQLDESMRMLEKAYEIDVRRRDTSAIGFDLKTMGLALLKNGDTKKSKEYTRRSINLLLKSSGNANSLGVRYALLAEVFIKDQQWDSAIYYASKSLEEYKKIPDGLHIAEQWIQYSKIATNSGEPENGLKWAQLASNYFNALEPSKQDILANECLINAYFKMGDHTKALPLIEKNLNLSQHLGLIPEQYNGLVMKAMVMEKRGETDKALSVMKEMVKVGDSIRKLENSRMLEAMRVRYETERVAAENEQLMLENQLTRAEITRKETAIRNIMVISILLVLIAIGVVWSLIYRNKLKMQVLQAEVNELRVRIKGIIDFQPQETVIEKQAVDAALDDSLTEREFEILTLAISDMSNAEIAEKVYVSVNTVKYHLKNIYQKLGVANRREALKAAIRASSS